MPLLTIEPKEAVGLTRIRFLRLFFLVASFFINKRLPFGKSFVAPAWRPSRQGRDQKTFSSEPRSFSAKELWFPADIAACWIQPVFDSRHGRITCKMS
jgi:hypothetical protein